MSILRFNNIGIHSVSACVPSKVVYNSDLKNFIAEDELNKTIHSIGIQERRIAEKEICSSDLCFKAAEQLIEEQNIIRDSIGALIFISQTPDYRQPSTAPSLQSRLGLSQSVMSFDINMACSGYIYGLSIAYSLALQEGIGRVLLLVGETMSKTVSNHDKVTTPLFGDAGSATLIERSTQYGDSCFSLHSDGSGSDILRIPYGGYRSPSCIESLEEVIDGDGNILTGEQLHMKGMDVFNFGLRVVPSGIKEILKALDMKIEDYNKAFDLDVKAVVDLTIKALPYIIKSKGSIINLPSVGATHPGVNLSMYVGAKVAIENFTRVWALELADKGVRVNAIAPGAIRTNIWDVPGLTKEESKKHEDSIAKTIPFKRFGRPEEVANVAYFLASDEASYVSGSVYAVDGGQGAL